MYLTDTPISTENAVVHNNKLEINSHTGIRSVVTVLPDNILNNRDGNIKYLEKVKEYHVLISGRCEINF